MKRALPLLFLAATAHGALIDLGPPDLRVVGERTIAWDSGVTEFAGQTISMDITFANNEFIRIRDITNRGFMLFPCLVLNGTGLIHFPAYSAYPLDQNGLRNGAIWSGSDGSYVFTDHNETIRYSIGGILPMIEDGGQQGWQVRSDVTALDVYGLHTEFTLPVSTDFTIIGATFLILPGGWNEWNNSWAIGPHVPDNGSTIALLALSAGLVFAVRSRFQQFGP